MLLNNESVRSRGIVIAAPNSNSGKTVFTMGLVAALQDQGLSVAAAKAGPGFIDPQFLSLASDAPCHSLDKWAMGPAQVRARAAQIGATADLVMIEGMMGMFDGAAGLDGSTADLAATLDLPVLFLVDASGQAQSIAALVHGFATLRPQPKLCGVIATQVGSSGHGEMLRDALIETGIPLVGTVMRSEAMHIPSRHLGLVQAIERAAPDPLVEAARDAVEAGVDLDLLISLCQDLPTGSTIKPMPPLGQRIAVARDAAFGFAYPHLLEDWQGQGAEVNVFSPLSDEAPDLNCDAVYLPGGYPELHAAQLASARNFMDGLAQVAHAGARIYGECGGFMALGQSLTDADGHAHRMAGLLGHSTSFAQPKMHIGYRTLFALQPGLWDGPLRGHEFHWSDTTDVGTDPALFRMEDARGIDLGAVGGRRGNVFGSYAHIIDRSPAKA
ncbi:MAG: cobyrinate a,c-diamide synthase [Pseudomonadota bacterium]